MDMKFKAPMSKRWELKDDRIIVGNDEYYFSEIKKVEHKPPQYVSNNGMITIYVEGGVLGSDQVFFAYKYSDSENGKIAAKYLIDKVKNTEYNPDLTKDKKKKSSGKTTYIFAFIFAMLSAILGFNITYDGFIGRILSGALFAVIGFFAFLIVFILISTIIDSIFPTKLSNFFKGIILIASVILMCYTIVNTVGWGGYESNNNPSKTNKNDSSYNDTTTHNNQTQQSHECYVCGDEANLKYGSHYYCNTHWAMVKTIVEAD